MYVHMFNFNSIGKVVTCRLQDPSLGFEAILNMGEEIDVHFDVSRSGSVVYHKIPLVDGPSNPIPAEAILDAVRWIENHRAMKMLIHCRFVIGVVVVRWPNLTYYPQSRTFP
jgi:hypothetical protein